MLNKARELPIPLLLLAALVVTITTISPVNVGLFPFSVSMSTSGSDIEQVREAAKGAVQGLRDALDGEINPDEVMAAIGELLKKLTELQAANGEIDQDIMTEAIQLLEKARGSIPGIGFGRTEDANVHTLEEAEFNDFLQRWGSLFGSESEEELRQYYRDQFGAELEQMFSQEEINTLLQTLEEQKRLVRQIQLLYRNSPNGITVEALEVFLLGLTG